MHGSYTDTDGYSMAMMRGKGYQAVIEKDICNQGSGSDQGQLKLFDP